MSAGRKAGFVLVMSLLTLGWLQRVPASESVREPAMEKKGPPREVLYRSLDPLEKDSVRYLMTIREEPVFDQGQEYVQITQNWKWASGRTSEYWNRLKMDPAPGKTVSSQRREYDREGNLLLEETTSFLADPGEFPPNAYPYTAIFTVHQNLLEHFPNGEKFEFFSVFPGNAIAKIISMSAGKENIRIGDTSVECIKVRMLPDMSYFIGIIGSVMNVFVQWFMPKSCMWFLAEEPHVLIRYEGLSGGEKVIRPVIYEIEENSLRSILNGEVPTGWDGKHRKQGHVLRGMDPRE